MMEEMQNEIWGNRDDEGERDPRDAKEREWKRKEGR